MATPDWYAPPPRLWWFGPLYALLGRGDAHARPFATRLFEALGGWLFWRAGMFAPQPDAATGRAVAFNRSKWDEVARKQRAPPGEQPATRTRATDVMVAPTRAANDATDVWVRV